MDDIQIDWRKVAGLTVVTGLVTGAIGLLTTRSGEVGALSGLGGAGSVLALALGAKAEADRQNRDRHRVRWTDANRWERH